MALHEEVQMLAEIDAARPAVRGKIYGKFLPENFWRRRPIYARGAVVAEDPFWQGGWRGVGTIKEKWQPRAGPTWANTAMSPIGSAKRHSAATVGSSPSGPSSFA